MRVELYKKYFKNKRVTMMGLGLLGRGIGDALFLAPLVKELLITDKKTEDELKSSIQTLREKLSIHDFNKIKFVLGEHREEDFVNTDMVMKSAGVPLDSMYIQIAKENNIPIYMSAALVTKIIYDNSTQENNKLANVKVIGVTGTRGKSTTTMMIHNMLTVAGKRVHLGGNVRGVANLPLLDYIEDGDYLLMELDSWQLQGFGDLQISPGIAVFTSFLDDHLNYYKGDREAYFADKANIFLYQNEADKLIISKDVENKINKFCTNNNIKRNIFMSNSFLQNMNLIGHHNQVLAGLVNEVGIQLGLDYNDIAKGISSFKAVEGRLQYMGKFNLINKNNKTDLKSTIEIYNDNNATTPDATIAAIRSVIEKYKKKPILLLGGADKGLDLTLLEREIKERTKAYVLLAGTGTDILQTEKTNIYDRLEDAVARTFEMAENDDIFLYSPGFASFSKYFKNEYEKNDEFVRCVNKYKI